MCLRMCLVGECVRWSWVIVGGGVWVHPSFYPRRLYSYRGTSKRDVLIFFVEDSSPANGCVKEVV